MRRLSPPTAHPTQAVRWGPLRRVGGAPGPGLPEALDSEPSPLLSAWEIQAQNRRQRRALLLGCPQTLYCQLAFLFQSSLNVPKLPAPPPPHCFSALIHGNGAHSYGAHCLPPAAHPGAGAQNPRKNQAPFIFLGSSLQPYFFLVLIFFSLISPRFSGSVRGMSSMKPPISILFSS